LRVSCLFLQEDSLLRSPQVVDTIFRIHAYFFERDSPDFKEILSKGPPNGPRMGSNEDNAIFVKNCTVEEFERFLWVFYIP